MTATFCTSCGAPLNGPFCSQCGTAAPRPSTATGFAPPPVTPAPAAPLPPPYAPPPPLTGPPGHPRGRKVPFAWVAIAAVMVSGVIVALALGGSSRRINPVASGEGAPGSSRPASLPPLAEPGTRSSIVPPWANSQIGRLVTAQLVLGASGTSMFVSPGHNTCAVLGSEVSCVATPLWHKNDPAALPAISAACSTTPDGRWSVFAIDSTHPGSVVGCTATPPPLTLRGGTAPDNTAPDNKVIGMGSSGILCLIDARQGAPASQTGVACWNPATNHGFMITYQDMHVW